MKISATISPSIPECLNPPRGLMLVSPKKKFDNLKVGVNYPVYHIETQKVQVPLENLLSKKKRIQLARQEQEAEIQFDKDDERLMDDAPASIQEITIVWLLIGNRRLRTLQWVDSDKMYYTA